MHSRAKEGEHMAGLRREHTHVPPQGSWLPFQLQLTFALYCRIPRVGKTHVHTLGRTSLSAILTN